MIPLDRALATWGDHDWRWHKRVSALGQPALVSVPGLYEAPVKPEAYDRVKQRHAHFAGGAPPREVLENRVEATSWSPTTPRTTDALLGYVRQAYHSLGTGEAFCPDARCRLYNAHRQSDLLAAQLGAPEFCDRHGARYGT